MNENLQACLDKLTEALEFTGVPILRLRAALDYYKVLEDEDEEDREYVKEVVEITYKTGKRRYADIGCDSNIAALYDVLAVLIRIKPDSSVIQRIVYPGGQRGGDAAMSDEKESP